MKNTEVYAPITFEEIVIRDTQVLYYATVRSDMEKYRLNTVRYKATQRLVASDKCPEQSDCNSNHK